LAYLAHTAMRERHNTEGNAVLANQTLALDDKNTGLQSNIIEVPLSLTSIGHL